jgi:hypothetical protein
MRIDQARHEHAVAAVYDRCVGWRLAVGRVDGGNSIAVDQDLNPCPEGIGRSVEEPELPEECLGRRSRTLAEGGSARRPRYGRRSNAGQEASSGKGIQSIRSPPNGRIAAAADRAMNEAVILAVQVAHFVSPAACGVLRRRVMECNSGASWTGEKHHLSGLSIQRMQPAGCRHSRLQL